MKPTGQHDPWTLILDELEFATQGWPGGATIQRVIIEFNRLRASNAKLLAACECQQVMSLRDGPIVAIHAVQDRTLRRHGWDGQEDRRDFVDRLVDAALINARDVTPSGTPSPPHP
jgi:hypothetical protein